MLNTIIMTLGILSAIAAPIQYAEEKTACPNMGHYICEDFQGRYEWSENSNMWRWCVHFIDTYENDDLGL